VPQSGHSLKSVIPATSPFFAHYQNFLIFFRSAQKLICQPVSFLHSFKLVSLSKLPLVLHKMYSKILFLSIAALAAARTDLSGCVSSETVAYGGASLLWYVPGTGEICAFLDCGGGAGAPITTQPGCADYSGSATYSPSYLANFNAGSASSTSYVSATTTTPSISMITGSQTTEAESQPTTSISSSSSDASASDLQ